MDYNEQQVNNFMRLLNYSVHGGTLPTLTEEDWEAVFCLAERQNLLPLICEVAAHDESIKRYPAYRERLFDSLRFAAEQDEKTAAFLKLYSAFIDNNCYPIVVKGVLCRRLYGEKGSFRLSGDEDILIRYEDFDAVEAVLKAQGYQLKIDKEDDLSAYDDVAFYEKLRYVKELTYFHPQIGLRVEVHINPFGVRNQLNRTMNGYFEEATARCVTEEFDGVALRTFAPTDHLLFLILHAFKHFIYSGFGLRMALDIVMFMNHYQAECDREVLNGKLKAVNAEKLFNDILALANTYWGFDLPLNCEATAPELLLRDLIESGTFGNDSEESTMVAVMSTAAIRDAENHLPTGKLGTLWRLAFPGKEWLYSTNPKIKEQPLLAIPTYFARAGKGLRYLLPRKKAFADKGFQAAQERIDLLKQYEII